ncbi:MAG: hypothetical protein M1825_002710 [Sarcosagium campestre]|nr:MAG: hypothetical protein M1825_002710 [Sarcosagium campestre]
MESVNTSIRQSTLPSIGYLDFEKARVVGPDHQRRSPPVTAPNILNGPLASPTGIYQVPPPPYSYPAPMASTAPTLTGLISPPESRRTSGDEKKSQAHRHSLPSIQEALGREQPLAHPFPPSTSAPQQQAHFNHATSPTTPIPRSHPTASTQSDLPRLAHTQQAGLGYGVAASPAQAVQPPQASPVQTDSRRISLPSVLSNDSKLPSLHSLRHPQSPIQASHIESQTISHPLSSPRHDNGPRSADSMKPNSGHCHYQSQYPYPTQTPPATAQSQYPQAPPTYSLHNSYSSRFDGSEVGRVHEAQQVFKGFKGVNGEKYGTSVKRHLEYFDLEASLNEIADSSGRLNEFSREYRNRTREVHANGSIPGVMPTLAECDEMMRHESRIQDLLARLRELLVSQQNALASQRSQDRRYTASADYEMEDPNEYPDDTKPSSVLGAESKKRRGRAAPPGRCHSCNRAETPEWRRGPDGARTLCNACGLRETIPPPPSNLCSSLIFIASYANTWAPLDYAKLTRKMGTKTTVPGAALRPKSMMPNSPQQ